MRVIGLHAWKYLYTGFHINVINKGVPSTWIVKLADKTRSDQFPIVFGLMQFGIADCESSFVLQELLEVALEIGQELLKIALEVGQELLKIALLVVQRRNVR